VVRANQLFAGQLVEALREAFRSSSRVAEHDRRAVRAHQLEHARMHVRPDALVGFRRIELGRSRARARLGHVVDGDDHLDVEVFARTGVDDGDRTRPVLGLAAEEARDLVEWALRRRQPDPLRRRIGDRVEPLE
jgi:hypothetical protein